MFTAYVFIEINTIAAGGLILIRETGHTLVAATKYTIMSPIGSGLILIGISMLLRHYRASSDVQYERDSSRTECKWSVHDAAYRSHCAHVRGTGDQVGAVSVSQLAAGCLQLWHGIFKCHIVKSGVKKLYFFTF